VETKHVTDALGVSLSHELKLLNKVLTNQIPFLYIMQERMVASSFNMEDRENYV
jgi:hypothetical protein